MRKKYFFPLSLFRLDRQVRLLPGIETADERMNISYAMFFQYLRRTGA